MNETEEMIAADGHAAPDEHAAHNVAKHVRKYLLVGATLITFTAITVFLSYVNFGTMKANVAVAMLVATFKACWFFFICGCRSAKDFTNEIPSISPTALKSPVCSGTSSISSGFSSFRFFICSKP